MTTADHILFNPAQLVLELSEAAIARAWQQSQSSGSRWQDYLNRLVVETFLPWVRTEEAPEAELGLDKLTQANLWSVVNGTLIELAGAKLALIPTEAEDLSELRIPQEWVDIPELIADYYLAVQINVDAGYLRVWGYATHQKVKQSELNTGDRTYSLSDEELISDLNVLWLARELCPEEVTQTAVETILKLDAAQAKNLIQRLGSQSQLLPRLAVPFATWAALIQNSSWLKDLAAARRGKTNKIPVVEWLKQELNDLTSSWRQIELTPSASVARGAATKDNETAGNTSVFGLAKKIAIADQPYELKIVPLATTGSWRFEFYCVTPGCTIPAGFKLRLLTATGEDFTGNEDLATNPVEQLFLEVDLDAGESLRCQIELADKINHFELLQF